MPALTIANDRYIVISADCHGGGDVQDYRPYLSSRHLDEFDAWAGAYAIPFMDLITKEADLNWDSDRRLAALEEDGIVAEVIFPNTVPPFFSLLPPTASDVERRWAGLQAHNRWLADFCARTPGRRAGVAQISLHDVDAAVAEVRWVKEAGLTGGVLVPAVMLADPLVPPLWSPAYDPIWAACEELGVPVNHHAGFMSSLWGDDPASGAVYNIEGQWFSHRILWAFIFGGVLERHPDLKLVLTESAASWTLPTLELLDNRFEFMRDYPEHPLGVYAAPVVSAMSLLPSEYFARNCYLGVSFMRRVEAEWRHRIGLSSMLWGSDFPHTEGTRPYTLESLRWTFAGIDPGEVGAMLSGNSAHVYGFDLEALAPLAAEIGPAVAEVAEPLAEVPAGALSGAFSPERFARPW